MMRSLFAGVSGLRSHQTRMDVIGNNIANVNTPGFKRSRVTFQEMLNQTIRGAASPQDNRGGTNPTQIGLGVNLGSIDVIHTPGSPQSTGKALDMSVEGEGYFVVGDNTNTFFTRAGNFDFDTANNLVTTNGLKVKGWVATIDSSNGFNLSTAGEAQPINLNALAEAQVMQATTEIEIGKNLDRRVGIQTASDVSTYTSAAITGDDLATLSSDIVIDLGEAAVLDNNFNITDGTNTIDKTVLDANRDKWQFDPTTGKLTFTDPSLFDGSLGYDNFTGSGSNIEVNYQKAAHQTPITVYDSQGGDHEASVVYYKSADNEWKTNIAIDGELINGNYEHDINFSSTGQIDPTTATKNISHVLGGGVNDLDATLDFSNLTQVASTTTALALSQDGFEPGSLQNLSVDTSGKIVGTFSNGQNLELAQVALATFRNPGGLMKVGNTMFSESKNSGNAQIGTPGTAGRGVVKPETLEMSNVDLSQEFVDMITTQRGFQANSRIITTSDEMLQELVNLRR